MVIFATHNFIEDMALVMCVAALAIVVFQLLHQPLVLGYLIAGMIVGPNVPGLYASTERIKLVSQLGVILLIFSIGLEFKFRRLRRLAPTAGLVAVVQAGVMIIVGYVFARLIGWTPWESLLTGATLSISGAVIIAKVFEEVKVEQRVHDVVFGIVLCEDLIAILLLAAMITLSKGASFSFNELSINAGFLTSFVVAVIAIGLLTVPYLVRGVAGLKRPETLLITSMGLCFAFATIAERAGYEVALGAFLAGSLVAESGQGDVVAHLIEPVRHIFGAIFFVSVGMLIEPQLLIQHWIVLLALTALVVAGKIVCVSAASMVVGERPDTAVKVGFSMAQIGVFSYLIAEVGGTGGLLYSMAVGVSGMTAFLCPFLVRASDPAAAWLERHLPMRLQSAFREYDEWLARWRKDEDRDESSERDVPSGR
jgi:monovalent cation:H+ antiporter-2, CPA2 family